MIKITTFLHGLGSPLSCLGKMSLANSFRNKNFKNGASKHESLAAVAKFALHENGDNITQGGSVEQDTTRLLNQDTRILAPMQQQQRYID